MSHPPAWHNPAAVILQTPRRSAAVAFLQPPWNWRRGMAFDLADLESRLWGAAEELRANSTLKGSEYSVPAGV
jgi:hypothetical protein